MSQLPRGTITPGTKPRGGGCQVSFPRPWCHVPASAVLQASRGALLAVAELLRWNQLRHLVWTQQTWRIGKCLLRTTPKHPGPGWARAVPQLSATRGAGGGPAAAGRGGCVMWPYPCALCSWHRTGAGLKNTWIRACRTCRMLRPACEMRSSGSLVSHLPQSLSGQPGPRAPGHHPSRGSPAEGGRACNPAGRAGGHAAGSVLGSAGSDRSSVPRACCAAPEGPTWGEAV